MHIHTRQVKEPLNKWHSIMFIVMKQIYCLLSNLLQQKFFRKQVSITCRYVTPAQDWPFGISCCIFAVFDCLHYFNASPLANETVTCQLPPSYELIKDQFVIFSSISHVGILGMHVLIRACTDSAFRYTCAHMCVHVM